MALYALAENDVASVQLFSRYLGSRIIYTFHYYCTTPGGYPDGPAAVRKLADLVREGLWTGILKTRTNGYFNLDFVQAQLVHPTVRVYERIIVNDPGTFATTDPLPANTAAIVTRNASMSGRGRNSALHLCGQSIEQTDTGSWSVGYVGDLDSVGDWLKNVLTDMTHTIDWTPIIWTKTFATQKNVIRSAGGNNIIRTERRRTVGQGI